MRLKQISQKLSKEKLTGKKNKKEESGKRIIVSVTFLYLIQHFNRVNVAIYLNDFPINHELNLCFQKVHLPPLFMDEKAEAKKG